jgi:glycosyltransferase involved in cell wall biosynthesis
MKGPVGSPIRVLMVIDSLMAGGAELLLSDFAVGARATGIEVSVAYLGERNGSPAAARLRERGIDAARLDLEGLLHLPSLARVRRHIRALAPDLVHTHLAYADAVGGMAARSLGIPVVSTVHVMEWETDKLRDRVRQRLISAIRRRCTGAVITVSDASRSAVLAAGGERPKRVVTIRNGVVAKPRPGSGRELRAELGIAADDQVLAQVAVLRSGKGHEVAAGAVARLRERHPKLRLLVAGDGPARAATERALAPLGDAGLLLGHRDDVMAVLDATDILVHPSTVDALPTALMEAMAASVPVVATRVGGIPEIVKDSTTGLLVEAPPDVAELANALEALLGDAALRRRLGAAARVRYEREFTAESWALRTKAVYERVLTGEALT